MLDNKQQVIKDLKIQVRDLRKLYTDIGYKLFQIENDLNMLKLFESGDLNEVDPGTDLDKIPRTPYFPNPSNPPYYNPVVTVYGCPTVGGTGLPIDYYSSYAEDYLKEQGKYDPVHDTVTKYFKGDSNEEESK